MIVPPVGDTAPYARRFGRRSAILAAIVTILATVAAGILFAQDRFAFYTATEAELKGSPGTLIRWEPMDGAPLGATAYRVLYRSIGLKGAPIAVSGMVIVPPGTPPRDGWPIIAWAHPTSGVVRHCAPSLTLRPYIFIEGLRTMVTRGYVVAATDYPGLGTVGPHPYLVGISEGRAVLDSVRAAQHLPGIDVGRRFVVWGHSQGGHAALFTGLLAKTYAPDLDLLGVAAAAPASELAILFNRDLSTPAGKSLTSMTLWSWSRVFGAPMGSVLDPSAIPAVDHLANDCIESFFDIFYHRYAEKPLEHGFLAVKDLTAIEPWRSLTATNTPGTLAADIPIFLAQGRLDQVVPPPVTQDYMRRLCKAGSAVAFYPMPTIGHASAARVAAIPAVDWIDDRFAGKPAPTSCGPH